MSEIARSPWFRPVLVGLLLAGIAGYAAFLWRHVSPYAGGSDPSGYLNSARLLSEGRFFTEPRILPGFTAREFGEFSNVPLGFVLREDGHLTPTYPVGYPLQLLVLSGLGWSKAVKTLNVATALAGGLVLFAYCRMLGLAAWLSLGGVVLLWSCPLFIFLSLQPMSDLSALTWSLLVLYNALRVRESLRWGLFCGAAMGIAVLVRPTNILLAAPLLVALGFRFRSWLAVGLGGLPFAAFFCYYSWRLYGSPFVTGYGDVSGLFRKENLLHNLAHFSHWIPLLLSPLVLFALVAPGTAAGRRRGVVVPAVWVVVLIGLYAFYYHSGETWWYLRFILPAFPALILGTLVVLETGWREVGKRSVSATVVLALLLLAAAGWQIKHIPGLDVLNFKNYERSYPEAAQWARENLPAQSAVFCMQVSGAFLYYTDFLMFRWEQIMPEKQKFLLEELARQHRPVYAALFSFETADALERIGGHWVKLATVGQVTFWQRQP